MRKLWWTIGILALGSGLGTPVAVMAQGQPPISWQLPQRTDVRPVLLPAVDVARLVQEDAERSRQLGQPVPPRYGTYQTQVLTMGTHGVWTDLPDGGRMWRVAVRTPGALSQQVIFDQWVIPAGATVHLYTPDRLALRGPFDAADGPQGEFTLFPVPGPELVVEYREPVAAIGQGRLRIAGVVGVFRPLGDLSKNFGLGDAGQCHTDVSCSDAAAWQDARRSVVLLLLNGSLCSGALINNTARDGRPLVLSADHCLSGGAGSPATWLYVFNFESTACNSRQPLPVDQTVVGGRILARYRSSDFLLMEMATRPPPQYNAYYAGWNANDAVVGSSVSIHHPAGDLKKISFDDQPTRSSSVNSFPSNSLWQVTFDRNTATEGGSSGSPLFDPNRRIIGQLFGGLSDCVGQLSNNSPDYYGKLSFSWTGGGTSSSRLRDHLDPINSGELVLNGQNPEGAAGNRCLSVAGTPNRTGITAVAINGTSVHTSAACTPYTDHSGAAPLVAQCVGPNTLAITSAMCTGPVLNRQVGVFVDWNRDQQFAPEELMGSQTCTEPSCQVTVPLDVAGRAGTYVLRVVNQADGTSLQGCGRYAVGETEDFTLVVPQSSVLDMTGLAFELTPAVACQADTLDLSISNLRACNRYGLAVGATDTLWLDTLARHGAAFRVPVRWLPAGTLPVRLVVATESAVQATDQLGSLTVEAAQVVNLSAQPAALCADPVTLSVPAIPGATYTWRRNGLVVSTGTSPSYATTLPGSYQVSIAGTGVCAVAAGPLVLTPPFEVASPTLTNGILTSGTTGASYQWLFTGTLPGTIQQLTAVPIRDATGASYRPLVNGLYQVRVRNAQGCEVMSPAVLLGGLSGGTATVVSGELVVVAPEDLLVIYPNPAAGSSVRFNLRSDANTPAQGSLYRADGALVQQFTLTLLDGTWTAELPLTNLASGIYIVRVKQDGYVISQRLVVQ